MNKHKIAWIALAVGIVVVLMLTWLVGVSPRLTHIKEADAQTAQIEESNKKTRDQIETLRMRARRSACRRIVCVSCSARFLTAITKTNSSIR